jgi:HSP20 family protein
MYQSLFPRDLYAELDRLQREMREAFDLSPSIRGLGRGGFPALNIGGTPQSVEIFAFAPGLDPATVEINLDRGVLTIAGERPANLPADDNDKAAVHIKERFSGRYRRVFTLSKELDPGKVSAEFKHGVLDLRIPKAEHAKPRRIEVKVS